MENILLLVAAALAVIGVVLLIFGKLGLDGCRATSSSSVTR
jgi:hypothetical protein